MFPVARTSLKMALSPWGNMATHSLLRSFKFLGPRRCTHLCPKLGATRETWWSAACSDVISATFRPSLESMELTSLDSVLKGVSADAAELYLPSQIPTVHRCPDPLEFYRNWVAPNCPVVFRGAVSHWPAITKWTSSYLKSLVGDKQVDVAVTPNGYADAVREDLDRFVMPHEEKMKIGELLDVLDGQRNHPGICYLQKQNSNFTSEYPELWDDAETELPWATGAFGAQPDAVNLWIGDARAVTSMHKDHYENLYCVVRGRKRFTLLPPTDLPLIPYGTYKSGRYRLREDGSFSVVDAEDHGEVPWIPIDPLQPDLERWPSYANAHPLVADLEPGDVLYLPSLWFHHVEQQQNTIAINFWYDMAFDVRYNYFKFLEKLTEARNHCRAWNAPCWRPQPAHI